DVLARRVGDVGVGAHLIARDHGVPGRVRVVDEEEPALLVVGGEGDAQEAALAAAGDLARNVEEGGGQEHVVLDDADAAGLLDHEHAVRIEPRRRHVGWLLKPRRDAYRADDGTRDRRYARADGGGALELTGGRAAVAARDVAVV